MPDQSANLIAVLDAHKKERDSLQEQIKLLLGELNTTRADFLSPDAVAALAAEASSINGVTAQGTGSIHPLDTV